MHCHCSGCSGLKSTAAELTCRAAFMLSQRTCWQGGGNLCGSTCKFWELTGTFHFNVACICVRIVRGAFQVEKLISVSAVNDALLDSPLVSGT